MAEVDMVVVVNIMVVDIMWAHHDGDNRHHGGHGHAGHGHPGHGHHGHGRWYHGHWYSGSGRWPQRINRAWVPGYSALDVVSPLSSAVSLRQALYFFRREWSCVFSGHRLRATFR